ncbi:bifunctional lysylphosphatidylglycerol synthetase/lysine--tRNA ligase LysX [Ornithinimicrobium sp. Y1847]|uniref:bifunctional lysylphosphatidylglycerol synthetase/lysine--tRNA ligase LysX n=1 Tax=Ornithinimicrobium sp. Y1847 TaxID=3405419 RepID=UPI003B685E46
MTGRPNGTLARIRETTPQWFATVLVIFGLFSLLGILLQRWSAYDSLNFFLGLFVVPSGPSFFLAALLLVMAGAVRRRFRAAHTVLTVVMSVTLLSSIAVLFWDITDPIPGSTWHIPALDGLIVVANLLVVGFVAWARPAFTAKMTGRSLRDAVLVFVGGIVAAFILSLALVSLPADAGGHGVKDRALWSLGAILGTWDDPSLPDLGARWIAALVSLVSAVAVIVALAVLWRGERTSALLSPEEELRVRELLLRHGEDDSLAYFATRRDKSVVFSKDGAAAVAYRAQGNVSVASGDPLGDPQSWDSAIEAWLADTREHGRYAAVLSAGSAAARLYTQHGLRALVLGDEAVLDVDTFSLDGRSMRPIRQAVNRVERAGYTAEVRRTGDLDATELRQLADLAEKWRGAATERGFSMALGRFGDPADGRCVVVVARDQAGAPAGLLSFVPWGRRGLSLDLMRRAPDAENGVTEFMVTALARHAEQLGVRRVSLNFAVFRHVFSDAEEVGAGPVTKASDAVLRFFSRFYQLDSLYRSNEKYEPTWVPRLLCCDPMLTAARAGVAMGVAEGFIPTVTLPLLSGAHPERLERPRDPSFAERVHAQESELSRPAPPVRRLNEQQRVRLAKVDALHEAGHTAYPDAVARDTTLAAARAELDTHLAGLPTDRAPDVRTGREVRITGRVRALRDLGGVGFAVLEEDGRRLQVVVDASRMPQPQRADWRRFVDLGDVVAVSGELGTSRTGEPSVLADGWQMAATCLNPVPDLHATLAEDARSRQRVLDLITSPDALDFLRRRALGVQEMRAVLVEEGYLEVETPMLQRVHGGAAARPFVTHINAYDMLFLRIAPELYI